MLGPMFVFRGETVSNNSYRGRALGVPGSSLIFRRVHMKYYLIAMSAIATAAAFAFEVYIFGVVLDICRVIAAG